MIEYILFVIGIIIILISLFLTYRVDKDDDDYYIESELLSEIRQVKKDVENNFKETGFQKTLNDELKQKEVDQNMSVVVESIEKLEKKVDKIDKKIDRLEGRIQYDSNRNAKSNKQEVQSEEYQKIKRLVDQGLTLTEAAHKLDMGNREVKLIWKLNSQEEE
ncbi:hypothetical protein JCM16358_07490 [Halanaerocella petrolearia]